MNPILLIGGLLWCAYQAHQWWTVPNPDGTRRDINLVLIGLAVFFMLIAPEPTTEWLVSR